MQKAIFIDKDGTLIPDIPYNVNPDLIVLAEGAEKLKILQDLGYLLIVVSNQSGIARGKFKEEAIKGVEGRLKTLLKEKQIELNGFLYCPHHPGGIVKEYSIECDCRKPGNGMLLEATNKFNIDTKSSWMIGDILNDVEAGNRTGCSTILIDNGNETEWIKNELRTPLVKVKNLGEACDYIFNNKN